MGFDGSVRRGVIIGEAHDVHLLHLADQLAETLLRFLIPAPPRGPPEDVVVIATNAPDDAREFVTTFGLNQPGAEIALKVFVILTTGNEAGSAAMLVERPANVQLLAA